MALTKKQIDDEAYKVIRGEYGNGDERKKKLGDNYDAVQSRVNELSKQNGGASNVKAPSSSNSASNSNKVTTTTVKTTENKQKQTTQTATKNTPKTSSTANQINNSYSTKEQRNEDRKNRGLKTVDTTNKKTSNSSNNGTKYEESVKPTPTAKSSVNGDTGVVKTLNKEQGNTIQLTKLDGSTKTVTTKDKEIPHLTTKSSLVDRMGQDLADYNAITVGDTGYKTGQIQTNKVSKAKAEELKKKYGITDKELSEANKQFTKNKIRSKEDNAVNVATERAKKSPLLGELGGLVTSAGTSFEGLGNLVNAVGKRNKDDVNFHLQNMTNAYRSGTDNKIKSEGGNMAVNLARGGADLLTKYAISTATGIPMAVLSAGSTSDQTMQGSLDRGASLGGATVNALGAGAIDYALQKKGLDSLLKTDSLAKKGLVEGAEETIQNLAGQIWDKLTTGEKSQFNTYKQDGLNQGLSDSDATINALKMMGKEDIVAGLGGALFGTALGGINKLGQKINGKGINAETKVDATNELPNEKIIDNNDPTSRNVIEANQLDAETEAELDAQLEKDITDLLNGLPKSDANTVNNVEPTIPAPGKITPTNVNFDAENSRVPAIASETRVENNPTIMGQPEKFTQSNVKTPNNNIPNVNPNTSTGDTNYSKVVTNTLINNRMASMANEVDRRIATYEVSHNAESLNNARNRVAIDVDADKWENDYTSGKVSISDETDVDTTMLLLERKKAQIENENDPTIKAQMTAQYNLMKQKLREAGTKAGQKIQAFAKWNGTAEGAITNTERMLDEKGRKWAEKNGKVNKEVERFADAITNERGAKPISDSKQAKKTSAKLSKALSDLGNDSLKAKNKVPATKKTHEQITTEVRNTLAKEFGSIDTHFSDADVEVLATFIDEGVPTWVLTDELQHKLQHGDWYTIDEYSEKPAQISGYKAKNTKPAKAPEELMNPAIKHALDVAMGEQETSLPKEKLTIDQIRSQIRNTFDNEFGSISENFTDDDVNYLAAMVESKADSETLANMMRTKMATGLWDIPQETVDKVTNLFDEARRYDVNSRQRVELETKAFWELANASNDKASILDKFNSWRYLAMLGNPKTHVRNIVGNTLFQQVTNVSNVMSAIMEEGVDSVAKRLNNGQGIERTKAIINPLKDKDLLKACLEDADAKSYRRLAGNKYSDGLRGEIQSQREIFDSKLMRKVNEINSNLLDAEDYKAMKGKYKTSLAGFLKANGADVSIFDAEYRLAQLEDAKLQRLLSPSEQAEVGNLRNQMELLDRARDYAIGQAEYSAFHEDNKVATWLSNISREANNSDSVALRTAGKMFEGVLPFKKTPANILKSGIDYSPLNIVNDVAKAIKLGKGNTTASDLIESLSKTFTGTGLMMLGAYLYDKNALNSSDDETKWQDSLEGIQNYSITVGGKTYTIDFAAPSVMPLLLGAEAKKAWDSRNIESGNIDASLSDRFFDGLENTVNVASKLASPIMETSMLSGINDTLEELSQGNTLDALGTLAGATATGYLTQGIPTILGQVARTIDPLRRSTYTDKQGLARTIDKKLLKQANKIPFLSKTNEPYVDAYGREQNNSPVDNPILRGLYQGFSPSYVQDINTTPVDAEVRRLYGLSKNDKVFSDLDTQGKVGDSKLSKEAYTEYSKIKGELDYASVNNLINNPEYSNMSDADKEEFSIELHNLAKKFAQSEYGGSLSTKESKLYDAYKENGVQGLVDSIVGNHQTKLKASELGFFESDGDINTDKYNKVKETFDGNTDDIELYGKAMQGFLDNTGESLKGNTSYKKIIGYLDSTDMSPEEKGKIILGTKGFSELSADAISAYEEDGYAGIYNNYNDVVNKKSKNTESTVKTDVIGRYGKGNIDLYNRPQYKYDDGSIATVESMSFEENGKEVLIPTIAYDKNGKAIKMTDDEAIDRYYQTGEYLGKFNSIKEADDYAEALHLQQEDYYAPKSSTKKIPSPQDLSNNVSNRMIEQGANEYQQKQEEEIERQSKIENKDLSSYMASTSNGGKRFKKEGLPMIDAMYETDEKKSMALINEGVSTQGVNKTRKIFGDDSVYTYYSYKYNADINNNDYVSKDELRTYLQSQGLSDDEIALWWNVFKKD